MRVTVTRKHLQYAVMGLFAVLVLLAVLKLVFKVNLGPGLEHNLPDAIIVLAVAIFGWNRYLVAQEKKAKEAEEAELKAAETPIPSETSIETLRPSKEEPKA